MQAADSLNFVPEKSGQLSDFTILGIPNVEKTLMRAGMVTSEAVLSTTTTCEYSLMMTNKYCSVAGQLLLHSTLLWTVATENNFHLKSGRHDTSSISFPLACPGKETTPFVLTVSS